MSNITAYITLIVAVFLGTASNSFAKSAEGFTVLIPSIITAITIVGCMYALSQVMKVVPVGVTYASFAGLCIIATSAVGVIKFNLLKLSRKEDLVPLGGIKLSNLNKLKTVNSKSFAMLSEVKKKPAKIFSRLF